MIILTKQTTPGVRCRHCKRVLTTCAIRIDRRGRRSRRWTHVGGGVWCDPSLPYGSREAAWPVSHAEVDRLLGDIRMLDLNAVMV